MPDEETHSCRLRFAADGTVELCAHDECAFWEPGGAVLSGRCVLDRLGTDLRRADFAGRLLEVRERANLARGLDPMTKEEARAR